MHAIASMLPKLRDNPSRFGLVTANGGYLSKHASGIYSATPVLGKWERENPSRYQKEIDSMESPDFTETPEGLGTIETYTVCHTRGIPDRGIVIGRLAKSGKRFLANTPVDSALFINMMKEEQIGRTGTVSSEGDLNIFMPA